MYKNNKICIVIPYYNAPDHIGRVVAKLPSFVDSVIIVDDKSPVPVPEPEVMRDRLVILHHQKNLGVGGATMTGFKYALKTDCDIVVKMDADDQMDASYLPELLDALIEGSFDYAKGNRFYDLDALRNMPFFRRTGNLILSFLVKAATGYWNNFDPTNGYFAIKKKVLSKLNFNRLSSRYFFETSLLAELYYHHIPVADIPMPAIYKDEKSHMKVWTMPFVFLPRLIKLFFKRILFGYFLFDFNIGSVYLLFGLPLFLFGIIFGAYKWWYYASHHTPAPTGTIMIAVLSLILGFQLLLQAVQFDIHNAPKSKSV